MPLSIEDANGLQPYEIYLRELHIAGHGYKIMIKRLLRDRTVLCPQKCMRTWIAAEKAHPGQAHAVATTIHVRKRPASCVAIIEVSSPDELAPYAAFLLTLLHAGAGWRGLTTALYRDHNVRCSLRTMRTWVEARSAECWDSSTGKRFTPASSRPILEVY